MAELMCAPRCRQRMSRAFKNWSKRVLHRIFYYGQRLGVDILPRHFYSSIPDLRELAHTDQWRPPLSMVGVHGTDVDQQLQFLTQCCPVTLQRRLIRSDVFNQACMDNGDEGYGPVEADFLFCFVASRRPAKIVQVGAGVSTTVIVKAVQEAGYKATIACIDPIPTRHLRQMAASGEIELIPKRAQDVDLRILTELSSGDLLFVDSTHTVKPGSEVNRIIFEVLPRLPTGCYVHFHDIHFPFDYPPSLFDIPFFPSESSLLHAFLISNSRYVVAVSLSMLHHSCPDSMRAVLPRYQPAVMNEGLRVPKASGSHYPSATYLYARS